LTVGCVFDSVERGGGTTPEREARLMFQVGYSIWQLADSW